MKRDWTRTFWVKTLMFLTAAVLAPLLCLFAASVAFTLDEKIYDTTEPGRFFETDLCESAVWREANARTGLVWYYHEGELIAADGYTGAVVTEERLGELSSLLEKQFSAEAGECNLRVILTDNEGVELYNSTKAGDLFVYGRPMFNRAQLAFYVDPALSVHDEIYWAEQTYQRLIDLREQAAVVGTLLLLIELLLVIALARAAGRRPEGDEVVATWQERIPLDLYLAVDGALLAFLLWLCLEGGNSAIPLHFLLFYAMPAAVFLGAVLLLGAWLTLCTRVKLGEWWKNTLIYACCRLIWRIVQWCWGIVVSVWRGFGSVLHAIPYIWRIAALSGLLALTILMLAIENAFQMLFLVLGACVLGVWVAAAQLRRLQQGGEALARGDLHAQVDTKHMFWDMKRHGEDLNAVGRGMAIAVQEQLRSERLKTELITNVSHDIKTPLTSIINYVDLLQKEHTPQQEHEYLLVLDRQARKLKKLTEDLVEMSKASTGNLPCHPTRRSVQELLEQAVGEYSERLMTAGVEPVVTMPEAELFCMADGALMWRVLDNLLGNACKYAQSGTRLYLKAERQEESVFFTFKNVSRDALNVSADELLERFVRGDSARTTEGSGLGLNIAKSLVELQGGEFRLFVDGDLFKVTFTVPVAPDGETRKT